MEGTWQLLCKLRPVYVVGLRNLDVYDFKLAVMSCDLVVIAGAPLSVHLLHVCVCVRL